MKPMEVEILVAEVGHSPATDNFFRIPYDGSVVDEHRFCVLGGEAETIAEHLGGTWEEGADLPTALRAAVAGLSGPDRSLTADDLEVAVLDREAERRTFRRLEGDQLSSLLE
jgi:proteasome alpha subunit